MTPACGNCAHWKVPAYGSRKGPGRHMIGTCDKGGPTPQDGCSDTHRDEGCEQHEPREEKS